MLCINSLITSPFFNLASEEYLLKQKEEEFFMLWRSIPSIIVGRHQNALKEINYSFVKHNSVPVARRISGGGTVYHDLGNINFSFIRETGDEPKINYKKHLAPVINALKMSSVVATQGDTNELLINGYKISGNAECVYKNRILHHGTLLYSSELENLKAALKYDSQKYRDKSVKSNPGKVANLKSFLKKQMQVESFAENLFEEIKKQFPDSRLYCFNKHDFDEINRLSEIYKKWTWNFGNSPKYIFSNSIIFQSKPVAIHFIAEKGIIKKPGITGSLFTFDEKKEIEQLLANTRHDEEEIISVLSDFFTKKQLSVNKFVSRLMY